MNLINDNQMVDYVKNGYLAVRTGLSSEFHKEIFARTERLIEEEGQPGNNLLARIPELKGIFDDPEVAGALRAILGPNYYMYPHRFVHFNRPGSGGQGLHMDSMTRRRHHTRWVMAMYYPQDTTDEMGPTAVLPGSHYFGNRDRKDPPWGGVEGGTLLSGVAGTVNIVHYDLWHRGTANSSGKNRYMMKFLFTRMEEPRSPAWDNHNNEWLEGVGHEHRAIWDHHWSWNCGEQNRKDSYGGDSIARLIDRMRDESPLVNPRVAYELGTMGDRVVNKVVTLLSEKSEFVRRNASYALTTMGETAVDPLIGALESDNWWTRESAAETLADLGLSARHAVPALAAALQDDSQEVRVHAAEAIGTAGQMGLDDVGELAAVLRDEDERVRRSAALAMCRIAEYAEEAVPSLIAALRDKSRYVRGKAVHALQRIDTSEARDALMEHLITARWDPLTEAGSYY